MNFDLSEDQLMLKAAAERFVADRYDPERRRGYLSHETGFSAENWAHLGELGLAGAAFDATSGGLGLDVASIAVIFEALGHGMIVEPLIENVIVAGRLFEALANGDVRSDWLPRLVCGDARFALAHREVKARHNPDWVETRASRNGTGVYLDGSKSAVPAGFGVDAYLVSARSAPGTKDADLVGLYLVESGALGLSTTDWRMIDGSVAVSLTLDQVIVSPEHCLGGDLAAIANAHTHASLARAAEAVGIMERLFTETLAYLRTRKQFGKAIGSFQAIQHRMVAQYAALEQARALLTLAMLSDPTDHASFSKAVDGARAFISSASVELGHEMIQFHGGMGVTEELAIGHGHKRLLMLSRWPDDPVTALDRYASAG